MNRPYSATQVQRNINMSIQNKYFISPNYLPNMENVPKINNYLKEESYEEELGLLQLAWNELGITPEYRAIFINILQNSNETERINIFNQEKNNIKKFKDSLLTLKKEIENRESNLTKLKKINYLIQSIVGNGNEVNSINQILQNAVSLIKNLRINAVNIVKKISKVNQLTTYYTFSKKFNMNKLNPEYAYDPQYLYKMKDDLKFLKNSTLSNFIEMNSTEIDPFLTCCDSNQFGNKGNKIVIPISDDIMKLIIESRYELLQETVFNNNDKDNNGENFMFKSCDNIDNNSNIINKYSNLNNNTSSKIEKEKFRLRFKNSFNANTNYKPSFKHTFIQSTKGQNVSKYLHLLKNSGKVKYDNYFLKQRKNHSPFISKKPLSSKLRKNSIDSNKNKIIIIHEEIESLKHDQFMKRLGNIQNLDNDERKNEQVMNQIEERKVTNEYNENLNNEVFELKSKIKNMENRAKLEIEKRETIEKKNNELLIKMKKYQSELEQISQIKKKKENELNKKIELLQKELLILKNQKSNQDDDTMQKIKNLENNFMN